MNRRVASLLVAFVLALAPAAQAAPRWIEAEGIALQDGAADAPAARRRAVADAMLQAALAGGAELRGHSALSMGVVTSDLAILRPVGRVLEFRLLDDRLEGATRRVRIAAWVGEPADGGCADRPVLLTLFQPEIRVSTAAPAWAEGVATDIATRLREGAQAQPGVRTERIVAAAAPALDPAPQGYAARDRRRVGLAPGSHGLVARIELAPQAAGAAGSALGLTLTLALVADDGAQMVERVEARVPLPGVSALGRVGVLARPGRARLAADLTAGVEPALARLIGALRCRPVVARLAVAGGRVAVPVGQRHGLTRGAIAFTTDRDASTEMLEIVELRGDSAVLRPLDPGRPVSAFAGRGVQFLDTVP